MTLFGHFLCQYCCVHVVATVHTIKPGHHQHLTRYAYLYGGHTHNYPNWRCVMWRHLCASRTFVSIDLGQLILLAQLPARPTRQCKSHGRKTNTSDH